MAITITLDQIEALADQIEHEQDAPLDRAIQAGDWVRLYDSDRAAAWAHGHVIRVDGASLTLAYGGRDCPREWRRLGLGTPVGASAVCELWRSVDVVRREAHATENTSEWRKVW